MIMKALCGVASVGLLALLGCQQHQRSFTAAEKDAVKKEVKEQDGWKIVHSHESWVDE